MGRGFSPQSKPAAGAAAPPLARKWLAFLRFCGADRNASVWVCVRSEVGIIPVVVSRTPPQSTIRAVCRVLPFVASGNGEHAW